MVALQNVLSTNKATNNAVNLGMLHFVSFLLYVIIPVTLCVFMLLKPRMMKKSLKIELHFSGP